jgi:hypothetical protein
MPQTDSKKFVPRPVRKKEWYERLTPVDIFLAIILTIVMAAIILALAGWAPNTGPVTWGKGILVASVFAIGGFMFSFFYYLMPFTAESFLCFPWFKSYMFYGPIGVFMASIVLMILTICLHQLQVNYVSTGLSGLGIGLGLFLVIAGVASAIYETSEET